MTPSDIERLGAMVRRRAFIARDLDLVDVTLHALADVVRSTSLEQLTSALKRLQEIKPHWKGGSTL